MAVSGMLLAVVLALVCGSSTAYFDQVERLAGLEDGDDGTQSYLLPPKYRPHNNWEPAPDPRLYVLTEEEQEQDTRRVKRNNGPSLSIVNSLDVLRQRFLLEIARRRMRQSEDQILANREMLKSIGKREVSHQPEQALENTVTSPDERVHASSAGNSRSRAATHPDWSVRSSNRRTQL